MKDAVAARIRSICAVKGISILALAGKAKLPPSTVYGIANGRGGNPGIAAIARICATLDMKLHAFFDSDVFGNL